MKSLAVNYHKQGATCAESIIMAASEKGFCDKSLVAAAMPFSGGISSGCLCGAVAASLIVLGVNFDKNTSRAKAKEFMDLFKNNHKATCCRVLSAGFERGSVEHRNNCSNLIAECAETLENMVKIKVKV